MLKQVKNNFKKFLASHMDLKPLERFVPDINLDCIGHQKRVLVAYLDYFRTSRDVAGETVHTNRYELFQIINAFIRMNCVIDVCAYDDEEALEIVRSKEYDIIFGMGKVFREAINTHPDSFSILYLTESPYELSLQREQERIDYLYERRNIHWDLYRTGRVFDKDDEKRADAVICMSDTAYLRDIGKPAYRIYPHALHNQKFTNNFAHKKKENFLVLGTAGFVHKGIDILVEVFIKHPDWQLYLCGHDLPVILKKLGYNTPIANIHDCGYVDVHGEKFLMLAEKCVYILLPSCAEGMPTGILTGMRHGMIPIVTEGIGMDVLEQYCMFFEGYKADTVEQNLIQELEIPMEQLQRKSQEIYEFANKQFTLEQFTDDLQDILGKIWEERFGESSTS